jgi:hypothetical protein
MGVGEATCEPFSSALKGFCGVTYLVTCSYSVAMYLRMIGGFDLSSRKQKLGKDKLGPSVGGFGWVCIRRREPPFISGNWPVIKRQNELQN